MKPSDIKILDDKSHVLCRPEMYIGGVSKEKQKRWIIQNNEIIEKEIEIIPAIVKLFDEVISNSVDEAIKTNFEFANKIIVDVDEFGYIHVEDNGRGLTSEKDIDSGEYKAVLAFTRLRAGSNFGDKDEGTIGRFGVGVSLTNFLSKKFYVSSINTDKSSMSLDCKDNNNEYSVKFRKLHSSECHGTTVSYKLDFDYFHIDGYSLDIIGLIKKRVFDLSMIFPEIRFKFNKKRVTTSHFKDYVCMINKNDYVIHEDGYKLAVLPADDFSHISFINGIDTMRGGTHVDYISNLVVSELRTRIEKKYKISVKPSDIKSKLLIVVSIRGMSGAKYDSQTKERYLGSNSDVANVANNLQERFFSKLMSTEAIINPIVDTYLIKKQLQEQQHVDAASKQILKKKITKLIEANGRDREKCILFLTEGDSALGQLFTIRNAEIHAGLPLRGKVMNVTDVSEKDMLKNVEFQDIMNAIGLSVNKKVNSLRYGKIVLLQDADPDGHCITGLLLNFFYKYWPELFEMKMISKYLSPIVIATKGKEVKRFYNIADIDANLTKKGYTMVYNKGLGSLSSGEYSYMINNPVEYVFNVDDFSKQMLDVVFGGDVSKRKEWLSK